MANYLFDRIVAEGISPPILRALLRIIRSCCQNSDKAFGATRWRRQQPSPLLSTYIRGRGRRGPLRQLSPGALHRSARPWVWPGSWEEKLWSGDETRVAVCHRHTLPHESLIGGTSGIPLSHRAAAKSSYSAGWNSETEFTTSSYCPSRISSCTVLRSQVCLQSHSITRVRRILN